MSFALVNTLGAAPAARAQPVAAQPRPSCNRVVMQLPSSRMSSFHGSFRNKLAGSSKRLSMATQSVRSAFYTVAVAAADKVIVEEEKLSDSHVRLTITVTEEEVARVWKKEMDALATEVPVPGFRKGAKVPEQILVNFMGVDECKGVVIETLLRQSLPEAMAGVEDRAISDSERVMDDFAQMKESFGKDKAFTYRVEVDVNPTVTWTEPYKGMEVDVPALSDEAKDEEKVEYMIEAKRKEDATLRVAIDAEGNPKTLEKGMLCILSFSSNRKDTGEQILGAQMDKFQLDTTNDTFLPGFIDNCLGLAVEEEKEFEITFPPDWEPEALRGVVGVFKVKALEILERELPELNDAYAPKLAAAASTLEEARSILLAQLQAQTAEAMEQRVSEALMDKLGDRVQVEVPGYLFDEQGRSLYSSQLLELQMSGKLPKDAVQQMATPQAVKVFMDNKKDDINKLVKVTLGVADIFYKEGISVSEEELAAEIVNAKAEFEAVGEDYEEDRIKEQAREVLEGKKVLEWLRANSKINITPPEDE